MIKVEIMVALKGSRFYPVGEIVEAESRGKLPADIRGELQLEKRTCRVIYEEVVGPRQVRDSTEPLATEPKEDKPKFVCEYCGRSNLKSKGGLKTHERSCKKKQKKPSLVTPEE